jgi:fibro-slime domain-containing protein
MKQRRGLSAVVTGAIMLTAAAVTGSALTTWANNARITHEQSLSVQYSSSVDKVKEQLSIENVWFGRSYPAYLNITLSNTGNIGTTIKEIRLERNNVKNITNFDDVNIIPSKTYSAQIPFDWRSDDPTDVSVTTERGNIFRTQITPPLLGKLIIQKKTIGANGTFNFDGDLGQFSVETSGSTGQSPGSNNLVLNGIIRDFNRTSGMNGHPDFEKCACNPPSFGLDVGIVLPDLGSDGQPVYAGTAGNPWTTSQTRFDQWYHDATNVNVKKDYAITLIRTSTNPPIWSYDNAAFFPIDGQLFGNEVYNHNYHFTYHIHSQFTYQGGETFSFTGDDDVWVFINKRLAIDLGGVHPSLSATANLDALAIPLGLTVGNVYDFDFFFAERHTTESNFHIDTSLQLGSPGTGTSNLFYVDPGQYNIRELVPANWTLESMTCDDQYQIIQNNEIRVTVPAEKTVTCTFTNQKV